MLRPKKPNVDTVLSSPDDFGRPKTVAHLFGIDELVDGTTWFDKPIHVVLDDRMVVAVLTIGHLGNGVQSVQQQILGRFVFGTID